MSRPVEIVTESFSARLFAPGATDRREFAMGDFLVRLRLEDGWTYFASVDDIPELPPAAPQRLPEYLIETNILQTHTRTAH